MIGGSRCRAVSHVRKAPIHRWRSNTALMYPDSLKAIRTKLLFAGSAKLVSMFNAPQSSQVHAAAHEVAEAEDAAAISRRELVV